MMLLAGEYVYISTLGDDGIVTIRRVPRAGGAAETLASIPRGEGTVQGHRNMALLGDDLIVTASSNASSFARSRAPLYKVQGGKLRPFTLAPPKTLASTGLIAHDGKLYWTAANTTGSGAVMETTAAGVTRTILCEAHGPYGCEHHVINGTPAVATDGSALWLLGAQATKLPAPCPDCTEPTTVVGGVHVLCMPTPAAEPPATCKPAPTLVKLDDGSKLALPRIGDDLQLAAGRYYHIPDDNLVRRAKLDGPDQVFAPNAEMFAADDRGVVWVGADQHLWSAPH